MIIMGNKGVTNVQSNGTISSTIYIYNLALLYLGFILSIV
jgi:hypothetical protein